MSWLERILAGQPDAELELVERYTQGLLQLARRQLPERLQQRVDPEDVVQSVYRSFFRRLNAGEFQFEESHDVWRLLAVITYHKVYNVVRHHGRKQRDVQREVSLPSDGANAPAAARSREPQPADLTIMAESLEMMLAELPDDYRRIVLMRMDGHSIADIAESVDLSPRTVLRALSKLREVAARQMENDA